MSTSLKPIQPVYFNLDHLEDKEFWDDIHSDKIPNFTKWVKSQWIIWKGQPGIQIDKPKVLITQIEKPPEIESIIEIPLENSKKINANSLTKMFGIK